MKSKLNFWTKNEDFEQCAERRRRRTCLHCPFLDFQDKFKALGASNAKIQEFINSPVQSSSLIIVAWFLDKRGLKLVWILALKMVKNRPNKFWTGLYHKNLKIQKWRKNSWKVVYILAKQCRSPFNLTIFFKQNFKILKLVGTPCTTVLKECHLNFRAKNNVKMSVNH